MPVALVDHTLVGHVNLPGRNPRSVSKMMALNWGSNLSIRMDIFVVEYVEMSIFAFLLFLIHTNLHQVRQVLVIHAILILNSQRKYKI